MNKSEIELKTREIIAFQFGVELEEVTMQTDFIHSLNADSLDSVEVIMSIEDRFDINVPVEEADTLLTVQAVSDYVERKLADKSSK